LLVSATHLARAEVPDLLRLLASPCYTLYTGR
jgi:hypothetical protein